MSKRHLSILAQTFLVVLVAGCEPRPTAESHAAATVAPASSTSAAARVIDAQTVAYNARDLDAFMALLAPDVRLYAFPDSLMYSGRETLRPVYGRLFESSPNLRAEIHERMVQGNFVVDRETTAGMAGRPPVTGLVISEVKNGLITRIWFLD